MITSKNQHMRSKKVYHGNKKEGGRAPQALMKELFFRALADYITTAESLS